MAKQVKKVDDDTLPPPPDLKSHELGELHRKATSGDEGGGNGEGDDWEPDSEPTTDGEKKKPGRPKKLKETKPPRETKPIEIRAASIVKDMFCHFKYDHNLGLGITNDMGNKSGVPIHDDMRVAFKQLVPHLAMIFGALTIEEVNSIKPGDENDPTLLILHKFQVTGFVLDEYDESEGVTLIGSEELPSGLAGLDTPIIRFMEARYDHGDALRSAIDLCIFEVEEYLHGRKRGDQTQTSLAF